MVQENFFHISDLIFPCFLTKNDTSEIQSIPNNFYYTENSILKKIEDLSKKGLKAILAFPKIDSHEKDEEGSFYTKETNFFYQTLKAIKKNFPDIILMADVALDPYTSHGHDGIFKNNSVLNDATIDHLCILSTLLASSGVDILAPSDMMDGRIKKIRQHLDQNGFEYKAIMSYSCKFASQLYSPFRLAVDAHLIGDKKGYQLSPSQSKEALVEAILDVEEGADIILVKPGMFYLDILEKLKHKILVPLAVYHTSGEYIMIHHSKHILNEDFILKELLLSFKRAGSSLIITYYTEKILNNPHFFTDHL
jgi:porphobilinogen synthase